MSCAVVINTCSPECNPVWLPSSDCCCSIFTVSGIREGHSRCTADLFQPIWIGCGCFVSFKSEEKAKLPGCTCLPGAPRSSWVMCESLHLREPPQAERTPVYWIFLHACWELRSANRLIWLLLSAQCCGRVTFNWWFPFSFSFRSVDSQEEVCGVSQRV